MSLSGDSPASAVLLAAQAGDQKAAANLLPLVYAELHELARARLARQPPGQTLTPTALVHEAYLRIAGESQVTWEGRQHFFFAAARAMRDILVEQARRKAGLKRGGGRGPEEVDRAGGGGPEGGGRPAARGAGRGLRRPGAAFRRRARGPRGARGARSPRPAQG